MDKVGTVQVLFTSIIQNCDILQSVLQLFE